MIENMKQKAFTMAETVTVIALIGVLATILIPSTVNHHVDNIDRVKIKKAVTYYEALFKKLAVDNHFMTDEAIKNRFGVVDNCAELRKHFTIIETYDGAAFNGEDENPNCVFRTNDDVWWDVNDITRPKIAVKKANIAHKNESNNCKLYQLSGHIVNGVLRINDLGYLPNGSERAAVEKAYGYMNKTSKCVSH